MDLKNIIQKQIISNGMDLETIKVILIMSPFVIALLFMAYWYFKYGIHQEI